MTVDVRRGQNTPYFNVVKGDYKDVIFSVTKFGRNAAVGTTFVPVALGGIYRTPQVGAATAVRVKAGDVVDTALGDGAREVTVQGLDQTGALVSEALPTAGASAGAASTTTFIRLFRAFVSESGTYASQVAGSHTADIVIENAAGTEDWLTIDATDFPKGQSEIAVYTVPLGHSAMITNLAIQPETAKVMDVILFQRSGILETAAPYQGMRVVNFFASIDAPYNLDPDAPLGLFPELTDIGFMAKVPSSTGKVSIAFEIIVMKNDET